MKNLRIHRHINMKVWLKNPDFELNASEIQIRLKDFLLYLYKKQ